VKHIWRIIRFTSELWPYYLSVSIFSILISVMSTIQPIFTKGAVDQATHLAKSGHANVKLAAIFAIAIFLADVGQTLFSNIGGYLGDIMAVKLRRGLQHRYYSHLLSLPQTYFDTELSGKIINRMNRGITQISNFAQMISNNFLQFIFSTILSLGIVLYFSWQVAFMLFLLYPVFIWLTAKTSTRWQGYQKQINEHFDIAGGRFAESIGQVKVVKSFIQEARELKFFNHHNDEATKVTRPQSRFWHKQDVLRRLVLNIIFLAVSVYIFVETARGVYSVGQMVLLIQYAALIRLPIFSISFLIDQTQRAIADSKDFFEVMDQKPEIADHSGARSLTVERGEIKYDAVTFSYDKVPVLKDLSFTLKPDTKVALVGESGEGKTTITNLLMRLYEPQRGTITIDGQNINDVTQESLREQIGVVFQDPALFSGTIRENISYARDKATDAEVTAAAKAANADEFIAKLKDGYDTEIGERGLKLSGGQKQRIAIARALLKNAPILILDEATSSLDSKSEAMVQEALLRLMKGRTTIIIAHRLSTIENVDQIITIQGGTVDEIGAPSELAKSGGIYAQLLQLQKGHTETTDKKLKAYEIAG
jgi:ATP-binding cassette subfamily B protein